MLEMELEATRAPANASTPPEALLQQVRARVAWLLDNDFQQLMASLYQIDVAEELVAAAFRLPTPSEVAGQLAQLIVSRELKKAETRAERQFSL
jgi:hypothetical protein